MQLGTVLHVYDGEWGLPSIDFECLRALCLVKFVRCPVEINTSGNPFRSGTGKLPYLQIGKEKFIGYRKIKDFLDKGKYAVNAKLDTADMNLSTAFSSWVFTKLHVYYHYFLYGEPNNFDITRSLYAKRTRFPFNFYYPSTYQAEAEDVVLTMAGFDIYDKLDAHNTENIVNNAKKCVNILSKRLGEKVWYFGDHYSEFDATVYSYLAILFKINLPNNPLQAHIKACQNLVNFIHRISRDIFQKEIFNRSNSSKNRITSSNPLLSTTERKLLESETKIKIIAGLTALAAMFTFAFWRGLHKNVSNSQHVYESGSFTSDDDFDDEDMD